MVEDTNPSRDMVDTTGHIALESVSYEKDVTEIKLPDSAVVSCDCGTNFVKDVCIDEGAPPHRKISEKKLIDEKSFPNFGCLMIDVNGDLRYGRKDDDRKSVHELKLETLLLPVAFAPDGNKEKQYSSGKEYVLEDMSTAASFAGDINDKKISLEELLRLESAEESQRKGTVSSENSENHMAPLHGQAVGQVPINDCHGVEAIASRASSELVGSSVSSKENADDCAATASEERHAAAALDVRGPSQVNHYNPFVDHWSPEDACKPECSIPAITDAPSTEPISIFDKKTSSFSDVASGSKDALDSSSPDVQSSEKSNDLSESPASNAVTDAADETGVATSSSPNYVEPSDANGVNCEKLEDDGITDTHDFKQRDEENCVETMSDDTVSKSSTHAQKDSAVEQTVPDSAKVTARVGNGYPFEEPSLFGPSIMSGPVSTSGHVAYSGNVSLRSDSSTTSTRSFAFPVLQREWISSPVRMAEAERRRIRRRRGWRKGLLCCKF